MADIGIFGLGVMGTALARNIASKGFKVALFNRHVPEKEEQVAYNSTIKYKELSQALAFDDVHLFLDALSVPRKILLMVNAGQPVDDAIDHLIQILEPGDIIIDGGNSHYKDTEKRALYVADHGIGFSGCGISGGESGALRGPAIMPGGDIEIYNQIAPILNSIAAKTSEGKVCCAYLGKGGSGHFVKMVHNGIEYAEMQLISEMYGWMRYIMMMNPSEIALIFSKWNQAENNSYLLDVTISILNQKDEAGGLLIDHILDKAENKGTGGWTTIAACEYGVPVPGLTAALYARYISAEKEKRQSIASSYPSKFQTHSISLEALESAYSFARVMNHVQGLELIQSASDVNKWGIDLSVIPDIWSAGCIIRSGLLKLLREANEHSDILISSPVLKKYLVDRINNTTEIVSLFTEGMCPAPVLTASLDYFIQFRQKRSTAYLIQAQRDYFGAHKYQRLDDPTEKYYHTNWD